MYEEGLLVNGVIDALFEDNKGTLFIVDFKTDKIDISELENHSLKYVPQMTLYKRAVEKMFKTDKVKTILAYLRLDRLYEI
jgi:ATP-dependent exoDNAse (exonuclease V) beta subunit